MKLKNIIHFLPLLLESLVKYYYFRFEVLSVDLVESWVIGGANSKDRKIAIGFSRCSL